MLGLSKKTSEGLKKPIPPPRPLHRDALSKWRRAPPGLVSLVLAPPRRYDWGVDYVNIITIEPDKRGGKPCIRGLRITVYDVLDYLASGMTQTQILSDFPDLTDEDIRACLAFAADRERRLMSIPV